MNNAFESRVTLLEKKRRRRYAADADKPVPEWWGPLWRGLVVDPNAKHYKAIGSAIWIYVYLVVHADRTTGMLKRKIRTIASDMGIPHHTVQYGITKLRKGGYITTSNSGRSLAIIIAKWKPLRQSVR